MEQFFTLAWQKQAFWLWLLIPIAWLYRGVTWLHKKIYQIGIKKIYYPPVPVIVVGNITAGGSGKTPLLIASVHYLQAKHIHVGVISRGYGGEIRQMPCLVTPYSTPSQVGDEPCLIVQSTHVPMAVCPNRREAIELILQNFPQTQLILSDDGLQHFALDRDKNWIVVDGDRGFGSAQVLPVGFLREPLKRLLEPNTQVIFHQKTWQLADNILPNTMIETFANQRFFMRLVEQSPIPLFDSTNSEQTNSSENSLNKQTLSLSPQLVIAMTGIGYPPRFFNSLSKLGFTLIKKPFNDHHMFTLANFDNLPKDAVGQDLPIIVTAKDAVKIRTLLQNDTSDLAISLKSRIWVLPVVAQLSEDVLAMMDKTLLEFGIMPEQFGDKSG